MLYLIPQKKPYTKYLTSIAHWQSSNQQWIRHEVCQSILRWKYFLETSYEYCKHKSL